ncbi:hypothetical protein Taro_012999 [Colocasia esculenta]|uniref:NADH:ubiquinone reductase (non-electrogenic) n=1 Tax=Colocasia esculenta TaxID=4460 RepID=A0A843UAQ4_COLES|nr:hypothetical protein [Colocasia esculenta]
MRITHHFLTASSLSTLRFLPPTPQRRGAAMSWLRALSRFSSSAAERRPRFPPPGLVAASYLSTIAPSASTSSQPLGLAPTQPGKEKPRLVVLGTGWAGCRLMKGIDTSLYDVVCVSPRNHMVFTPLLASTCVGTLEFRSVAEPVARIQPAISRAPGSYFFLARCKGIDADEHTVFCETVTDGDGEDALEPWSFKVPYDKLVIAAGAEATTFGIPGVKEYAIFLREVYHAQEIRRRLLLNLMLSDVPGITDEEKSRLLHCVVIGGGPTGVEFSGELSDFIIRDVHQRYAHVKDFIHVTLIEANEILSSFDVRLRQYATKQLMKYKKEKSEYVISASLLFMMFGSSLQMLDATIANFKGLNQRNVIFAYELNCSFLFQSGVRLVRGVVKGVQPQKIILSDGTEVPYGLLVWSTGVGPSPFVSSLPFPKSPGGRIGIDEWLRVPCVQDVFAVGDCCGFLESTGKPVLPALAQVAERQGKYLAGLLNRIGRRGGGHANSASDIELGAPFVYRHLGSMATVGRYKALVDLRQSKDAKGLSLAGFVSWFIWRSAYLTRVVSWRNRFYVAINWLTTFVFGRDISRI